MIQASNFVSACILRNYTFFTGVPCSLLSPLIDYVIQNNELNYIAATSEGEAIGIASGAYLAGRKAVVMCQNSGLGNAINPLTSLNFPFRIPILLVITLRGEPGLNDEPQHELMGQITGQLLDVLQIPWAFFPNNQEDVDIVLDQAEKKMEDTNLPFALILKKSTITSKDSKITKPMILSTQQILVKKQFNVNPAERMSRIESIKIIRERMSNEDVAIATTGKIGREFFSLGDNENQLYVVGSMGCASGIGLGIQLVKPEQRVVVLDGDGAALMKMGTLATIGCNKPPQFIHIILDNESYESTGGQYSVSSSIDFCNIASACGYRQCYRVDTKKGLISDIKSAKEDSGPTLIHVKVSSGSVPNLGRPTIAPYQVKDRFMRFLKKGIKDERVAV